ncbi:YrdB family protein [Flaviflexus sp.]
MEVLGIGKSPVLMFAVLIRFLIETAMLVVLAIVMWNATEGPWQWVAVIASLVVLATVWGTFLSPKALKPLSWIPAFILEALIFGTVAAGLAAMGYGIIALIGLAIWLIDLIVLGMFGWPVNRKRRVAHSAKN